MPRPDGLVNFGRRDYQVAARDGAFGEWARGVDSTLLVLPTGCGKTVVAGMVCETAIAEHGRRPLYLAHREELITQGADTLRGFGFDVAVEQGGQSAKEYSALFGEPDVVVASVQTMQGDRLHSWDPRHFNLIITDEAHHGLAPSYQNIFDWFQDKWMLGITATPARGDGRNLGSLFASYCYRYPLRRAIRERWLKPIRKRTCMVDVDLREIRTSGDDFNLGDLAERINSKIEDLANAIKAEYEGRKTVAFTPDVGSAQALALMLTEKGVPAEYVSGEGSKFGMSKAERRDKLRRYRAGEFAVLVNAELLIEGWDCKEVSCIAIVRPTLQAYRFTQMVGRGTRPCDTIPFPDCLVLDFDWQTDESSKDLCLTVELFDDGSLDPDVLAMARELEAKRKAKGVAGDVDPEKLVEEAEEAVRIRKVLAIRPTGKETRYATCDSDPVGVSKLLDVNFKRKYDMDRRGDNPASPSQLGLLRHLGVEAPEGVSKWGASKLIKALEKRREAGLAPVGVVKELLATGMNENLARGLSAAEAARSLAAVRAIAEAGPIVQSTLF